MSSSTNEKFFTPERIKKMQQYLIDHPIDHKYDELCTVKGMMSDDCKERMAAEYHQTKIRYEKLKKLNTRISRQK